MPLLGKQHDVQLPQARLDGHSSLHHSQGPPQHSLAVEVQRLVALDQIAPLLNLALPSVEPEGQGVKLALVPSPLPLLLFLHDFAHEAAQERLSNEHPAPSLPEAVDQPGLIEALLQLLPVLVLPEREQALRGQGLLVVLLGLVAERERPRHGALPSAKEEPSLEVDACLKLLDLRMPRDVLPGGEALVRLDEQLELAEPLRLELLLPREVFEGQEDASDERPTRLLAAVLAAPDLVDQAVEPPAQEDGPPGLVLLGDAPCHRQEHEQRARGANRGRILQRVVRL